MTFLCTFPSTSNDCFVPARERIMLRRELRGMGGLPCYNVQTAFRVPFSVDKTRALGAVDMSAAWRAPARLFERARAQPVLQRVERATRCFFGGLWLFFLSDS